VIFDGYSRFTPSAWKVVIFDGYSRFTPSAWKVVIFDGYSRFTPSAWSKSLAKITCQNHLSKIVENVTNPQP